MAYQPQDSMSLWWLADPAAPQRIGTVSLQDNRRKLGLSYDPGWLAGPQGFALSEDLPLQPGLHLPAERDTAVGAVDDARPDQWGERVIRILERPARLSLLEYVYFAGDDRFGALGVSLGDAVYEPAPTAVMASFDGLDDMHRAVQRVMGGEAVTEQQRRLLQPGVSMGGARPKSLMQMDGHAWVVKFSDGGELDAPLIEHASMQLARRCGIHTAETRALPLPRGHAVAVKRFDRAGAQRVHVLSAHVALRAAGEPMGYPELAQLLRRLGRPEQVRAQQQELFRRMVFNILIDNTDDHEKNHALVRGADGFYELSAAYDVLPAAQGLGYQQMRVGQQGHDASLANVLSEASAFGLSAASARGMAAHVAQQVAHWKPVFQGEGVRAADIELLAQYLDGAHLTTQRREALSGGFMS
ncbi:MAG: HipA domain-containing protein [Hydrogenophaga sp.]|uniref:type II toxin-antitoxin system HipA family toxin n=1 Tax=Hydrogenophaga sp. TaxID=1904254 RepID=UPI00271F5AC8|nr:HipA domain-containing protein [Hydrogenophaga sp.]MDO9483821.1 HipA domain-containing protein [Hydrogenophaga sp.]MDP3345479.1 HipA domain-containing protein [Hydrogenophaga sp.]MDP3805205.1 HipA domain-containing protein [Hydrogenophaga sp.]